MVGNAIPDRFANPGISGLSLLNSGIPGLNRGTLWLAIAGLVTGKIATTSTTSAQCTYNRAVKLHVSSLAHGSF